MLQRGVDDKLTNFTYLDLGSVRVSQTMRSFKGRIETNNMCFVGILKEPGILRCASLFVWIHRCWLNVRDCYLSFRISFIATRIDNASEPALGLKMLSINAPQDWSVDNTPSRRPFQWSAAISNCFVQSCGEVLQVTPCHRVASISGVLLLYGVAIPAEVCLQVLG